MPYGPGRTLGGPSGVTSQYSVPGGPSGATGGGGGELTKPTTTADAKVADRVCLLASGSWCKAPQGVVGAACQCADNAGRNQQGTVR